MQHRSDEKRQPSWRGKLPLALRRRVSGLALMGRGWRDRLVFLLLLITVLMGPNGLLTSLPAWAAQGSPFGKSGPPNRANPGQYATSILHLPPKGKSDPNWKANTPAPIEHTPPERERELSTPGGLSFLIRAMLHRTPRQFKYNTELGSGVHTSENRLSCGSMDRQQPSRPVMRARPVAR